MSNEPMIDKQYEWQKKGWVPFLWSQIEENEGGMSRIIGRLENEVDVWTLTVFGSLRKQIGEYSRVGPMLLKAIDQSNRKYQVATFKLGVNGQIQEINYDAYRKKRTERLEAL